jgi:P27 family predicted phage terminase small subunit
MRGRRAEIKAFEGTLNKAPAPPSTLPKEAQKHWRKIVADICDRGHLVEGMLPTIETLVLAMWTRDECVKAIKKDGAFVRTKLGQPKPHPAQGIMTKNQELIARLSAEFGLTAASRSRKQLKPISEEEKEDDWAGVGL